MTDHAIQDYTQEQLVMLGAWLADNDPEGAELILSQV